LQKVVSKEFAAKEKLEIVKERGEAQIKFLGACHRPERSEGRNASELFSIYAVFLPLAKVLFIC